MPQSHFLKRADIPAASKNTALIMLMYSEPTMTNMAAMTNPIPAASLFVLT